MPSCDVAGDRLDAHRRRRRRRQRARRPRRSSPTARQRPRPPRDRPRRAWPRGARDSGAPRRHRRPCGRRTTRRRRGRGCRRSPCRPRGEATSSSDDVAGGRLDADRAERSGRVEVRRARRGDRGRFPAGSARALRPSGRGRSGSPDFFGICTTTSWPPPRSVISTRASAIACRVTSLSRNGTSSISTWPSSAVSSVDPASAERYPHGDVACRLEDGHDRASGRRRLRPPDDADAVRAVPRRARLREIGEVDAAEEGWMKGHDGAPFSSSGRSPEDGCRRACGRIAGRGRGRAPARSTRWPRRPRGSPRPRSAPSALRAAEG